MKDLNIIMDYAETLSNNISVFACSMGAYFSLLAYSHKFLKQSLFISPVVNMEAIINNMMTCFGISDDRLEEEKKFYAYWANPLLGLLLLCKRASCYYLEY